MTFTRTSSGLGNYPAFFNSELVVYIEGKCNENDTFDEIYYLNLIQKITNKKLIKIKTVGNKFDALTYFEKIATLENDNSIVIIDKDYIGITSSIIEHRKLLITYGYSWENDFWTLELCKDVLGNITIGNTSAKSELEKSFRCTLRRVSNISALDAACQVNGFALLPKKRNSYGINLSHKGYNFISYQEFKRHSKIFRSNRTLGCSVTNETLKIAMSQQPCQVVQGHLWEKIVLGIISRCYKKTTKFNTVSIDMIKQIAFSKFSEDPLKYLTPDCLNHFKNQFSRLGFVPHPKL